MIYMLDTNMCIYIIKEKPVKALEALKKLDVIDVCVSAITLAELAYGVAKSQQREKKAYLSGVLDSREARQEKGQIP